MGNIDQRDRTVRKIAPRCLCISQQNQATPWTTSFTLIGDIRFQLFLGFQLRKLTPDPKDGVYFINVY